MSLTKIKHKRSPASPVGHPAKRVVFCTYPSVYSYIVLAELLRADNIEVVGAVLSTRVLHKNYGYLYAIWRQIRLSGLSYATYLFVITSLYQLVRRGMRKPTLKHRLYHAGIPVLETKDVNDERCFEFLRERNADIMLSAHFNQLVGGDVLTLESMECLNIHPSWLPKYRGVDPVFYALLAKESQTGVTVHFQEAKFDTGGVLQQQSTQIAVDDSLFGLNCKLFRKGVLLAIRQIQGVADLLNATLQTGEGRYDSWPDREQVDVFRQQRKLFRWREFFAAVNWPL